MLECKIFKNTISIDVIIVVNGIIAIKLLKLKNVGNAIVHLHLSSQLNFQKK